MCSALSNDVVYDELGWPLTSQTTQIFGIFSSPFISLYWWT